MCFEKTMKVLKLLPNPQPSGLFLNTGIEWRYPPSKYCPFLLSTRTEHLGHSYLKHGECNSRENVVTKSETRISELGSCYFSQERLTFHCCMLCESTARRWPSVSPFVNFYLYLAGNWASPKVWHMVSPEAQNKNIAPICTPTWFR